MSSNVFTIFPSDEFSHLKVVVWDDKEKVTLPFGWNRRVAKVRKDWLKRNGQLDPKDLNLHAGEIDVNVVLDTAFFHSDKDRLEFEKRPNAGRYVCASNAYVITHQGFTCKFSHCREILVLK